MSKINFTYNQIKEIEFEYITNGLSCEAIGKNNKLIKKQIL
jgi:hypothetical protein